MGFTTCNLEASFFSVSLCSPSCLSIKVYRSFPSRGEHSSAQKLQTFSPSYSSREVVNRSPFVPCSAVHIPNGATTREIEEHEFHILSQSIRVLFSAMLFSWPVCPYGFRYGNGTSELRFNISQLNRIYSRLSLLMSIFRFHQMLHHSPRILSWGVFVWFWWLLSFTELLAAA